MNCDKYLELMSAALDGECTAEERRELDGHLAVCPECARLFRILSANSKAARELDCEVPADLKTRIMSSLPEQEKTTKQGKIIHWKRWVPVAAAACLVLVISLIPGGLGGATMNEAAPVASSIVEARDGTAYGLVDEPLCHESNAGALLSDAPQEPENADPAHCAIYNPQVIRVHYGATPECGAVVIGSVDSLEHYLAQYGSLHYDEDFNAIPIAELEALKETYTEDFFRTHRLVCTLVVAGSGSIRYEIEALTRDSVTVLEHLPEIGTCDMAAWLLVAEVDSMFNDGDTLEVDFVR